MTKGVRLSEGTAVAILLLKLRDLLIEVVSRRQLYDDKRDQGDRDERGNGKQDSADDIISQEFMPFIAALLLS